MINSSFLLAAIAVSGGPDSMALCLLTHQYSLHLLLSSSCVHRGADGERRAVPELTPPPFPPATSWAKERGVKVLALTVDHGLRPESAEEAKRVHEWLTNVGTSVGLTAHVHGPHTTRTHHTTRMRAQ